MVRKFKRCTIGSWESLCRRGGSKVKIGQKKNNLRFVEEQEGKKKGDRNNLLENKLRGRLETGLTLEATMANMMIAGMFFLNINQSTMKK